MSPSRSSTVPLEGHGTSCWHLISNDACTKAQVPRRVRRGAASVGVVNCDVIARTTAPS